MLLNCGVGEDSWESLRLARRFNQSILKISPGCSLEGLMLKLKLQYFGHLMQRADSLEKTLMLEKIEGRRRSGRQNEIVGWHHWLNGHGFRWTLGVDGQEGLACCGSRSCKVRHDWATELNWKPVRAFQVATSGKQTTCQCRRCKRLGVKSWVRKIPWSRKWQPAPVVLPGKFHGRRSLMGYSPWGHKELDTTKSHTHTCTHTHLYKIGN